VSAVGLAVLLTVVVALLVGGRRLRAGSALVCVLLGLVVGTTPVGPAINQGLKSVGDWAWAKVSTL